VGLLDEGARGVLLAAVALAPSGRLR
jgi:hypothetical protein